jgi:hypothetical protein
MRETEYFGTRGREVHKGFGLKSLKKSDRLADLECRSEDNMQIDIKEAE